MWFWDWPDAWFCHPATLGLSGLLIVPCRWRRGFATSRRLPVLPRHLDDVGVVFAQFLDVDQADVGDIFRSVDLDEQFVLERPAHAPAPDREVFQLDQSFQMHPHLGEAPAARILDLTAAKSGSGFGALGFPFRGDDVVSGKFPFLLFGALC